jgi:dipeptidase E
MGTIAVIGGGELRLEETLVLDQEIVKLTGKEKPVALFIPTASYDAQGYCETFDSIYGEKLGCVTKHLLLTMQEYTVIELEHLILSADLIYVGGGNTRFLLETWRELGVDEILKKAYHQGVVLSGISAGSICWYEHGCSEEASASEPNEYNYVRLEGLGLLKGIHAPHYNEGDYAVSLNQMVTRHREVGMGIDNNCMIVYRDDQFRIFTSEEGARVHRITACIEDGRDEVEITSLKATVEEIQLEHLYGDK